MFDLEFRFPVWPEYFFWESLCPGQCYCEGPWVNSYIFSEGNWIVDEWGKEIPF
ncbi:hypothetical protein D082_13280 [Synechocystis sp. PCC 6714]|nr:hypothetical protein D082_13280 [Synechocystis sp. PCC 6714]